MRWHDWRRSGRPSHRAPREDGRNPGRIEIREPRLEQATAVNGAALPTRQSLASEPGPATSSIQPMEAAEPIEGRHRGPAVTR